MNTRHLQLAAINCYMISHNLILYLRFDVATTNRYRSLLIDSAGRGKERLRRRPSYDTGTPDSDIDVWAEPAKAASIEHIERRVYTRLRLISLSGTN